MPLPPITGKSGRRFGAVLLATALTVLPAAPVLANDQVRIGYLALEPAGQEPVSLLDPVVTDEGAQGVRLAIEDNNATGAFMGQEFVLEERVVARDGDVTGAFGELVEAGADWIVSDLPRAELNAIAEASGGDDVVIFNIKAPDNELRNEECRENLFHTIPSRAMLADALAQFLIFKRWNRWALVVGNTEEDASFAQSVKHSAERFGGQIVGEKQWPHTPLARRAEGGFHAIQREVPVFLQDLPDHDILLVIDETDYFGEYFPHQTWLARPVGGTQGLIPAAWHRSHESWGANQLHNRFERQAERWMTPRDFAAWIAVRTIGEAATRTRSVERDALVEYILSDNFELGAYLGDPVTYRTWDRQLRQPVLVTGPRMVVSVSPQEGFLHPVTPMDSLGHDEPETRCRLG
jgi:ABC transporter substrate binding protein (PQQ-dependent alcohol dehydrogenase system)